MKSSQAFAIRLVSLVSDDKFENYQRACSLLLSQEDSFASEVLGQLSTSMQGDYYHDHARECSYFIQFLIQRLTEGGTLRRQSLFEAAVDMQFRYGRSSNAIHATAEAVKKAVLSNAETLIEIASRLSNSQNFALVLSLFVSVKSTLAVDYLHGVLRTRADVRKTVLYVLEELADPRTFEFLLPLLSDPDEEVRLRTIGALFSLDPNRAALHAPQLVHDESNSIQIRTIQLIGQTAASECLPLLAEKLASPNQSVRLYAAKSLGLIRPNTAPQELTVALHDPNPNVRGMAAWALGEIADPACRGSLVLLTRDSDPFISWSATEAIAKIEKRNCRVGSSNDI